MYQLPVGNVEKIRKARKAVKSALSEIGLEDCQGWLKVRPIADTRSPEDLHTFSMLHNWDWKLAFKRADGLHLLNHYCSLFHSLFKVSIFEILIN